MANANRSKTGRSKNYNRGKKAEFNTSKMNKGNSSKDQRRAAETADTSSDIYMSKSNPYAWYANFPNYSKDVATLAFGLPVGQAVPLNDSDFVSAAGVMGLYFTPTIGVSDDLTSPVNRQTTRLFTYLRSIQRAGSDYDGADVMMYLMGIDSLYTYWAYLRRLYGIAQLFTPVNKYYPRRLLQAMGVDPDDICSNLANFRAYINRYALNIGRYAMPKDFDIAYRHMWMCSGLYVDSKTEHAQTYFFSPYVLYQFDNTVTTGSKLQGINIDPGTSALQLKTVAELIALGEQLIKNMENDTDTMDISGDLYRAYGPGGMLTVEETAEGYAVAPVYDEIVLSQIENAVLVGAYNGATGLPTITQNPSVNNGAILFSTTITGGYVQVNDDYVGYNYPCVSRKTFLNSHKDHPTHEDVMEMTRLVTKTEIVDDFIDPTDAAGHPNGYKMKIYTCGADMINFIRIGATSATNRNAVRFLFSPTNTVWIDGTTANPSIDPDAAELMAIIQQFDWAPMLYLVEMTSGANATYDFLQVAADLDNFTTATQEQIGLINEAAMLSVLDIPRPIQH